MKALCCLCLLAVPSLGPAQEAQVAAIAAFTEGPAVDEHGNVYFTETTFARILKWSPSGALTVFRENSNGANGLLIDAQQRLIACEAGKQHPPRVTRTDLRTGKIEVLADNYRGQRFSAPNDVTIDGKGRIYFTDLPGGTVYRIDPDRKLTRLLERPAIERPNGISISPDDKTLYLVEANPAEGGARMIRAYDLLEDGSVRNMRVFHNFYPGRSADGLCIDTEGNLYAAAGLHRRRGTSETLDTKPGIHVFRPSGQLWKFYPIPEDTITNCAFGGPDRKTLYVTAGKTLFRIANDIAGTPR
ncbi:MAG: SMP-30/gluconolactonase/LRE family protein [Bryobacteraceae bacterium]|nr:SMP-30/gluconolactonase/LRE family protein [Bryobacteraceae bacterium]MDW8378340.1 SMP-30/gluconolactonase/LRE family protein [Bryobacterales bacterium]